MPVNRDLPVWKGATFQARFDMQTEGGAARDVSGSTFVFRAVGPAGQLLRHQSGSGNAWNIPTPANGQIFLTLSHVETRGLPAIGTVVKYAIEEHLPNGTQFPRVFGRLILSEWADDDVIV